MVAFTPNRLLAQPTVGGDIGVWGPPLNNNQTVLDQILSQAVQISFASVIADVPISQAQMLFLQLTLTGTPSDSGAQLLLYPNMSGFWVINNQTPNPVNILTAVGGSTGPSCAAGDIIFVISDGTNVTTLSFVSRPSRVFAAAGNLTILSTDSIVLIQQTVPAAINITLPTIGGPFTIIDSNGVCQNFTFTVLPTTGTINGAASYPMDFQYQAVDFINNGNGYNVGS